MVYVDCLVSIELAYREYLRNSLGTNPVTGDPNYWYASREQYARPLREFQMAMRAKIQSAKHTDIHLSVCFFVIFRLYITDHYVKYQAGTHKTIHILIQSYICPYVYTSGRVESRALTRIRGSYGHMAHTVICHHTHTQARSVVCFNHSGTVLHLAISKPSHACLQGSGTHGETLLQRGKPNS